MTKNKHMSTQQQDAYAEILNQMAQSSERADTAERKLKTALETIAKHEATHAELTSQSQTSTAERDRLELEYGEELASIKAEEQKAKARLDELNERLEENKLTYKDNLAQARQETDTYRGIIEELVQEHELVKGKYDEALAELSLFRSHAHGDRDASAKSSPEHEMASESSSPQHHHQSSP